MRYRIYNGVKIIVRYKIYNGVKPRKWVYDQTLFIVSEVNWDYRYEFDYPDDWDELRDQGYADHNDAAIHMWLEKYHNKMYTWLYDKRIPWIGIQTSDFGSTVICVTLRDPDQITEFMLVWG